MDAPEPDLNILDPYNSKKVLARPQTNMQNNVHYNPPISTATLPSPLELLSSMIPPVSPIPALSAPPGTTLTTQQHLPHTLPSTVYSPYIVTPIPGRLPAPPQGVLLPPPQQPLADDPATSASTSQSQSSSDDGCCAECCPVAAAEVAAAEVAAAEVAAMGAPPNATAATSLLQQRYTLTAPYPVVPSPLLPPASGPSHSFGVARLGIVAPGMRVVSPVAPYTSGQQLLLQRSMFGKPLFQNGDASPGAAEAVKGAVEKGVVARQQLEQSDPSDSVSEGEIQQQLPKNSRKVGLERKSRRQLLEQHNENPDITTKKQSHSRKNSPSSQTDNSITAPTTPTTPTPALNPPTKRKEPTPPLPSTLAFQLTTHTTTTARCLWSTCAAVFRSIDELTTHLYKLHVAARTASSSVTVSTRGSRCRWDACYAEKVGADELISHLCADHLGFSADHPREEVGSHVCKWAGCGRGFTTFDELTGHVSEGHVGQGRSSYVCAWEGCDRKGRPFTQRQKVMRHIQTHTGDKPYQCNVCQKRFSESNIMTQHMRTHTGEKPFRCPEPGCGRQFSISGALTIHRRVHSGERPFRCRFDGCERRFAESSNLTKHMRVHTGERPFKCPAQSCGKRFSRPDQVTRHQKTHAVLGPVAAALGGGAESEARNEEDEEQDEDDDEGYEDLMEREDEAEEVGGERSKGSDGLIV